MSVISASRAAICWPPLNTPNSAAVLISLMLFGGPPAMPMIFAFEACACRTKDDKSGVASGGGDRPHALPPFLGYSGGGARSPEGARGDSAGVTNQQGAPRCPAAGAVPSASARVSITHCIV